MAIDDKVRTHLRDLGTALNEAISGSSRVQEILAKVKSEGYEAWLVLDATVALDNKRGRRSQAALPSIRRGSPPRQDDETAFQINVKDLGFLQSVGIDPTRAVRSRRRATAASVTLRSTVARKS